jgi:uncharacterized protein YeaO (DUF488 family)
MPSTAFSWLLPRKRRVCSQASVALSRSPRARDCHDPKRWETFAAHREELAAQEPTWQGLLQRARKGGVTLLYAAKDPQHNNAVVLKSFLTDI